MRNQAKKMFETILDKEGLEFLGWREVPIAPDILGKRAVSVCHVSCRLLSRDRKTLRRDWILTASFILQDVFLSSQTRIPMLCLFIQPYHRLQRNVLVAQLRLFFDDLQDHDYESAIAIVHSRFSTNTNPSWERAHPNRFIVHNGEINTIRGNADKMLAREETMESEQLKGELPQDPSGSQCKRFRFRNA